MSRVKPARILAVNAGLSILLLPLVSMNLGWTSLIALYSVFLLMSIMFPTIFALGIKDLGPQTKKGASVIVMAIVGGAVFPPFMGHISDLYSMSVGFLAPIPLFMFILYYALLLNLSAFPPVTEICFDFSALISKAEAQNCESDFFVP